METARERRSNATHKTIAVILTLIFHVALFGSIYYLMSPAADQREELKEEIAKNQKVTKQARS